MQFEIGKKYRTGSGADIWTCIGITSVNGSELPILLNKDGSNIYPLSAVLWNNKTWGEYREPVTVEGWVNVYDPPMTGTQYFFRTKESAEEYARAFYSKNHKYITTVYVKGTSDAS